MDLNRTVTLSCLHCWYSHGSEQNCHPLLFTLLILTWIWTELSPSLVYTANTHMDLNRTVTLSCLHCWYPHGSEQNCHPLLFTLLIPTWIWTELSPSLVYTADTHMDLNKTVNHLLFTLLVLTWIWTELSPSLVYTADTHMELNKTVNHLLFTLLILTEIWTELSPSLVYTADTHMDLNKTIPLSCLHCWYSQRSEQNNPPLLFTLLILTWIWTELSPSLVYTANTHMELNKTVNHILFTLLILTWIWTELSPSLVYTADTHMDLNKTLSCLHCWYSHGSEQNYPPLLFTLLILTWIWTELSPSLVYTANTHMELNKTVNHLLFTLLILTWIWTELSPSLVYTADTHMDLNKTVTLSCLHCWYSHGSEQNCHPLLFTLLILTWIWTELSPSLVYTADTHMDLNRTVTLSCLHCWYSHGTEQNCHPLLFTLLILTWIWTELSPSLVYTADTHMELNRTVTLSCLHCWYSHGSEQNCHPLLFTLLILTWIWTELSPSLVYTADTHMDLNRTVTLSCLHCWYSHGSEQNCHPLLFTLLILTWIWTKLSPSPCWYSHGSLVYTADTHMDLNRTVTLSCLHCWYSHGSEQNCHPLLFTLLILTWNWTKLSPSLVYTADTHMDLNRTVNHLLFTLLILTWIWTELSPSLVYTADTHMDLNRTVTLSCLHCWYPHGTEQNCHPLLFTLLILTWNWTELSPSLVYTADTHMDLNRTVNHLLFTLLILTWIWTKLSPSLVYTADTHSHAPSLVYWTELSPSLVYTADTQMDVTLSCLHCWYTWNWTELSPSLVYTADTHMELNRTVTLSCLHCWYPHGTEQNCHPLLFTLLILTWIWTELSPSLVYTADTHMDLNKTVTLSCLHCWYSHGTEQNCHPLLFTLLILTWNWTELSPSLVYTADTHMELNKTVTLSCLHCWYPHGSEQNCHPLLFTLLILTWIWTELSPSLVYTADTHMDLNRTVTLSCLHCWYSHGSEQNCHPLLFTLLILTWIWTELSPSLVYTADTHMDLNRTVTLSCLHCWYSHGSEQNCHPLLFTLLILTWIWTELSPSLVYTADTHMDLNRTVTLSCLHCWYSHGSEQNCQPSLVYTADTHMDLNRTVTLSCLHCWYSHGSEQNFPLSCLHCWYSHGSEQNCHPLLFTLLILTWIWTELSPSLVYTADTHMELNKTVTLSCLHCWYSHGSEQNYPPLLFTLLILTWIWTELSPSLVYTADTHMDLNRTVTLSCLHCWYSHGTEQNC